MALVKIKSTNMKFTEGWYYKESNMPGFYIIREGGKLNVYSERAFLKKFTYHWDMGRDPIYGDVIAINMDTLKTSVVASVDDLARSISNEKEGLKRVSRFLSEIKSYKSTNNLAEYTAYTVLHEIAKEIKKREMKGEEVKKIKLNDNQTFLMNRILASTDEMVDITKEARANSRQRITY